MFQVKTTIAASIAGTGLYQKGLNSSVTIEKGEQAIKAIEHFTPEIKSFSEIVKLKAGEYNTKLEAFKKEYGDVAVPAHLVSERESFDREFSEARQREIFVTLGDDQHRSLVDVCENAKKIWYKAMQEKNESDDADKAAKITAPSVGEFSDLSSFISDLLDAEKMK
jgi:Icc-related predicted phosphoesterase